MRNITAALVAAGILAVSFATNADAQRASSIASVQVNAPRIATDPSWPPSNATMRQVANRLAAAIQRRTGARRVRTTVVPMTRVGTFAFTSSVRAPWRVGTIVFAPDGRGHAYPTPLPRSPARGTGPVTCCYADPSQ